MNKVKAKPFVIAGTQIEPGSSVELKLNFAKLHTNTPVDVPVIIEHALYKGPTVLFTAGIHGDEVNGIEIVRQLVSKGINKPKIGTVICIPIVNIFGFLQKMREFPDGRDLNRSFPGSRSGSLAARVAHKLMKDIVPQADLCMDFHTGGSSRFNAPHVRVDGTSRKLNKLAKVFHPPFILHSKNLSKSFRVACKKQGVPHLLFEGGKSNSIDKVVSNTGVNGAKRVLNHLGMLRSNFKASIPSKSPIIITHSRWIRAHASGMFKPEVKVGTKVAVGDVVGHITDPYGKVHHWVKAPNPGIVFNVNEAPLVYQGDALFHISTQTK